MYSITSMEIKILKLQKVHVFLEWDLDHIIRIQIEKCAAIIAKLIYLDLCDVMLHVVWWIKLQDSVKVNCAVPMNYGESAL